MKSVILFVYGVLIVFCIGIFISLNAESGQQSQPNIYRQRTLLQKPQHTVLKNTDDPKYIEVKYLDHYSMSLNAQGFPIERLGKALRSASAVKVLQTISQTGGKWDRIACLPENDIEELRQNAQTNLNRAIAKLNNYFILTVPEGVDAVEWIDLLNALPEVELALPLPLPTKLPQPGNYQARQGYLNAATTGIDASYAWAIGDSGQNVTVCDLEYSWNLSHNDLPAGITKLVPPGYLDSDPKLDDNHGTAVLGELVSLNNGSGTTGACYGVSMMVAPTFLNGAWQLGTAMLYAISNLSRGDVILIEQQYDGPNNINPKLSLESPRCNAIWQSKFL